MTTQYIVPGDLTGYTMTKTAGSIIALLDLALIQLGWTKEFSGTNVAVYRNSTSVAGSSGCYIRVVNTNANYAQVRAFKTMSDIDTGTDPTPTTAQASGDGLYIRTGTDWQIMGDERTVYINIADSAVRTIYYFGDYESLVPGNSYNFGISAPPSTTDGTQDALVHVANYSSQGFCVARDPTNLASGTSTICILQGWRNDVSGSTFFVSGPDAYTGMYMVFPAFMRTSSAPFFGRLRGVFETPYRRLATWAGTIPWSGSANDLRVFSSTGNYVGGVYISSDDWE